MEKERREEAKVKIFLRLLCHEVGFLLLLRRALLKLTFVPFLPRVSKTFNKYSQKIESYFKNLKTTTFFFERTGGCISKWLIKSHVPFQKKSVFLPRPWFANESFCFWGKV